MKKGSVEKNLSKIAKSSLIVFIGLLISKISVYFYRIIVARQFGPDAYGLFSLAVMASGWFISISALGLYEGLTRYIPVYRGKNELKEIKYVIRFSFWITLILGAFCGFLLFLSSQFISIQIFHDSRLVIFLQIFSFLVPLSVMANPFLAALRGFENINLYSMSFNIIQNLAKVLLLLILIWMGVGTNSIAWSYVLGIAVLFLSSYYFCKLKLPSILQKSGLAKEKKSQISKDILSYSVPLMFYGIISTIFYWIDSFSIGVYKTAFEVGIYNAVIPIALLLNVAPELFMQLFFPVVNKEYAKKNFKLVKELSKQVGKWILLINLPLFAIIFLFPGAVINILFGSQYLAAETALRILALGGLFSSVLGISNQLVSMIGKSKLVLLNMALAAALNLILNSLLVPMPRIFGLDNGMGINGAAISTAISLLVFNVLFLIQAKRYINVIPMRRKAVNAIICAVVSSALVLYLRTIMHSNNFITLLIIGVIFIVVYALLLIATKALDSNDLYILKKALGRFYK